MAAETFTQITISSYPVHDAEDFLRDMEFRPWWADEINSITCPVGPRPGRALFLISAASFAGLPIGSVHDIVWGYDVGGGGLKQRVFGGYVVTAAWDAVSVDGSQKVVELMDARQYIGREQVTKRYNVREAIGDLWDQDSLDAGAPWKWADMVDDLLENAGTNFTLAKNPDTSEVDPENWVFIGRPVLECLEEICTQSENVLFLDPLAAPGIGGGEQLKSAEVGSSQPDLPSLLTRAKHRDPKAANAAFGAAPANIRVLFHWRPGQGNNWNPREPVVVDVASGIIGAKSGTYETVWGTRFAEPDLTANDSDPPVNIAELQAEANRIQPRVADYWTTQAEPKAYRYAGCQIIAPGSELGSVRWFVGDGGCSWTEIRYAEPIPPQVREKPEPGDFPTSNAGWIAKIPTAGIDPFDGGTSTPGEAEVEVYHYNPQTGRIEAVDDTAGNPVKVKARNLSGERIEGGSGSDPKYVPLLRDWEEEFWALGQGGGEGTKIVEFAIDGRFNSTGVAIALVKDPFSTGIPVDTTIYLYDGTGVWYDLEQDARGVAISIGSIDDPENPGTPKEFWAVIYAQRRIETYRVKLDQDLYGGQTVDVDWTDKQNRSALPYLQNFGDLEPSIINPLRVDCLAGGYIWVRRYWSQVNPYARQWYVHRSENPFARWLQCDITSISGDDFHFSVSGHAEGDVPPGVSPINLSQLAIYLKPDIGDRILLHYDTNLGIYFWVQDTRYKARWVHGFITIPADTSPNLCQQYSLALAPGCGGLSYWDGYNPGSAVPAWFDGLPLRCDEDQVLEVTAQYRREDQTYKVVTTQAALVGNVTGTKKLAVGGPNSIEFECDSDGNACLKQESVEVPIFGCTTSEEPEKDSVICFDSKALLDCLDICDYICTYCDVFSSEICDPPPPPPGDCCDDCEFTGALTSLTVRNGAGTAFNIVGSTQRDGCCWDVDFGVDGSGAVCYQGGGDYRVTVTLQGEVIDEIFSGDCESATLAGNPGGDLTADGQPCDGGDCCPEWGPGTTLTGMTFGFAPEGVFTQNGPAVLGPSCVWSIPGEYSEVDFNGGGGAPVITAATATAKWNAADQTWTVEGSPESPIHDLGRPVTFPGTCCGQQDCLNPPNNCKNGPYGADTGTISFTVNCVAPAGFVASRSIENPERPGDMLKRLSPELFTSSCGGCNDGRRLMNAWGCDGSEQQIERLVREFHNAVKKSPIESVRNLPEGAVRQLIQQAIAAERQRLGQ